MKNKKQSVNILLIVSTCLLAGLSQATQASMLYGATRLSQESSSLYSIDTITGVVNTIGQTGYQVIDLAWDRTRNTLFGATLPRRSTSLGNNFTGLITIDTNTGTGTPVSEWQIAPGSIGDGVHQIDIDSNGNMYGATKDGHLLSIESTTGVITSSSQIIFDLDVGGGQIIPIPISIGNHGFSFDSSDALWRDRDSREGAGDYSFYAVSTDLATGITSPSIGLNFGDNRLEFSGGTLLAGGDFGRHGTFDLSTDLYWAALNNTISMYDMTTGELKGALDLVNAPILNSNIHNNGIHTLAFASPVPVPAAVWLFGSGLIGLISFSKRQKA